MIIRCSAESAEEDEKAEEILETMQNLAPDDARVMTALLA